jgi:class 3 adenylate cyclase/tetratricopeptide (TPR) repeat protein
LTPFDKRLIAAPPEGRPPSEMAEGGVHPSGPRGTDWIRSGFALTMLWNMLASMADDISIWLAGLELQTYQSAFEVNRIDWQMLPELSNDDLREIGVHALGDRKRLLSAIRNLKQDGSSIRSKTELADVATTLRQVTVLFADLVGFTRLTSDLEAEQVHELLNRYFDAVDGAVVRYGGRVDKHIGDAVMGVFGAPVAHTNDPERALRAALDICDACKELEPPLGVHVGIASGQVIASMTGSTAHTEYTVTGEGVNLASRLTDLADEGQIIASQAVRRAAGDLFRTRSLGLHPVKGLAAPVEVWRVHGLAEGHKELAGRIYGREKELKLIAGALSDCREKAQGQLIVLQGEPGIGKSHLLAAIGSLNEAAGFKRVRAFITDFGMTAEQNPVHAIARGLLGLDDTADRQEQTDAALAFARELRDPIDQAHFHALLDLPVPENLAETFAALTNAERTAGRYAALEVLIRRACRDQLTLIEVEDLHWSTEQDLAALHALSTGCRDLPVTVVLTTRTTENPIDEAWIARLDGIPSHPIKLSSLPAAAARKLVDKENENDPEMIEACVERANGNPLFLKLLLGNTDRMRVENIPDGIRGIVQARIDALGGMDREIVEASAVLGQRFPVQALSHLLDHRQFALDGLAFEGILDRHDSTVSFVHALVRESIYETILKSVRKVRHRMAADWYAERDGTMHARHLDRAEAPEARAAYLAAAQSEFSRFEPLKALSLLERAREIERVDEVQFDLDLTYGEVLLAIGRTVEAVDVFRRTASAATESDHLARSQIAVARVARQIGDFDAAIADLAIAQTAAETSGSDAQLAEIHYLRGNVLFPMGRMTEMLASTQTAIAHAEKADSNRILIGCFSNLGDANYMNGAMRTAVGFYSNAIEIARAEGANRDLAANLHGRAAARLHLAEVRQSRSDAQEAFDLAHRSWARVDECVALTCLSGTCFVEGDLEKAVELVMQSNELAVETGSVRFEALTLSYAARYLAMLGRREEAQEVGRRGAEIALSSARFFAGANGLSALALALEDHDEQDRLLQTGADILANGALSHCHIFFHSDAIRISLLRGNWDTARYHADLLDEFTKTEPLQMVGLTARLGRLAADAGQSVQNPAVERELDELQRVLRNLEIQYTFAGRIEDFVYSS